VRLLFIALLLALAVPAAAQDHPALRHRVVWSVSLAQLERSAWAPIPALSLDRRIPAWCICPLKRRQDGRPGQRCGDTSSGIAPVEGKTDNGWAVPEDAGPHLPKVRRLSKAQNVPVRRMRTRGDD
jgi:hypothetical protein